MSPSLFEGLSLTRAGRRIDITYPCAIRDFSLARQAGLAHGVQVRQAGPHAWRIAFEHDAPYPAVLKAFFAQLNDHVPPPQADARSMSESPGAEPLVSCIVVVHANLPFVLEQLLPWLAASSKSRPLEIVLALNGEHDVEARPGVRVVRSRWGAVAAAYNAGAAAARGEFLAFFHDDCVVLDPLWIEKCLQRLAHGAGAVAGEYRQIAEVGGVAVPPLPVAKCVPLFLKRSDFELAGGFDERHYIGYEDLDFTLALAACGKKLVATDLQIQHFNGMSSTLKYNAVTGLADLYALGAVPRFAVMRRFKEFWNRGLVRDGVDYMRLGMDAQLFYLLRKYAGFLAGHGRGAYARAATALEERIRAACPGGPEAALACLRELDREAAGAVHAPR